VALEGVLREYDKVEADVERHPKWRLKERYFSLPMKSTEG